MADTQKLLSLGRVALTCFVKFVERGQGATAPVVCVEVHRPTAALAKANADAMGVGLTVVAESVEAFLAGPPRPFDVVWLDPPYDLTDAELAAALAALVAHLAPGAVVVVEAVGGYAKRSRFRRSSPSSASADRIIGHRSPRVRQAAAPTWWMSPRGN